MAATTKGLGGRPGGLTIILSSDHGGSQLRTGLTEVLNQLGGGIEVVDIGPPCDITPLNYALEGFKLAEEVIRLSEQGRGVLGIGICGSGIGISIALNRYAKVRAARVCSREDAYLARLHNDANILVLGGRQVGLEAALEMIKVALETPFEGGRHCERVGALSKRGS